jgi:hypothetical protein
MVFPLITLMLFVVLNGDQQQGLLSLLQQPESFLAVSESQHELVSLSQQPAVFSAEPGAQQGSGAASHPLIASRLGTLPACTTTPFTTMAGVDITP